MIDKKLLKIISIKKSIKIEKEFLEKHPEKSQFCELRIGHLHGKIATLVSEK